jgi:hypothetical protein
MGLTVSIVHWFVKNGITALILTICFLWFADIPYTKVGPVLLFSFIASIVGDVISRFLLGRVAWS